MLKRGKLLYLFLLFTLLISFVPTGTTSAAPNWNLVWSDEFDGNSLNSANWTAEIGTGSGAGATMNCSTIRTARRTFR